MAEEKRIGDDRLMRALLPVGRSGWAIAAGYLGLFSFLVIPAPLALLTGIVGVIDIRGTRIVMEWAAAFSVL